MVVTEDMPDALACALPGSDVLDARAAVAAPGTMRAPERASWVTGDETQYLIFTSGSTGRPKGIRGERPQRGLLHGLGLHVSRDPRGRARIPGPTAVLVRPVRVRGGGRARHRRLPARRRARRRRTCARYSPTYAIRAWKCGRPRRRSPTCAWPTAASPRKCCPTCACSCSAARPCAAPRLRLCAKASRARIVFTSGPTESTVAVTYVEIGDSELVDERPLPVGRARPGTELLIVDPETGRPLRRGADRRDRRIVGDTVAKGYFRNPEKTAAAFFDATLVDGTPVRAYRTGDAGHLDESGMLYCDGRFDSLVKVNGFRIELEDVEENLPARCRSRSRRPSCPCVAKSASYLKACVALQERLRAPTSRSGRPIRARLAERVPGYSSRGSRCRSWASCR